MSDNRTEKNFEAIAEKFTYQYGKWIVWFQPTKEDFKELDKKWPFLTLGTSEEDIEDIVAIREQQTRVKRRKYFKESTEYLKKRIADNLLTDLVDEVLGTSASSTEKNALKAKVERAIKDIDNQSDTEEISATVQYVLEGKYVPSEKQKERNPLFGYVWTVTLDVVSLIVLVGIFNSTSDNQQRLVLALLMLIYLAIRTLGIGLGIMIMKQLTGLQEEFQRLRELLNEEVGKDELEQAKETKKIIDKGAKKTVIDSIFLTIAYLFTLWMIVTSL